MHGVNQQTSRFTFTESGLMGLKVSLFEIVFYITQKRLKQKKGSHIEHHITVTGMYPAMSSLKLDLMRWDYDTLVSFEPKYTRENVRPSPHHHHPAIISNMLHDVISSSKTLL